MMKKTCAIALGFTLTLPVYATDIIDVLGIYSPSLKTELGVQMEPLIQAQIEYANTALKNSNVDAEYRLIQLTEIDVNPHILTDDERMLISLFGFDPDGEEWKSDPSLASLIPIPTTQKNLSALRKNAEVLALRESTHADLVTYFNRSKGGLAVVPKNVEQSNKGFSTIGIKEPSSSSYLPKLFAHEAGHNLGLVHQSSSKKGIFAWGQGYSIPGYLNTVMSTQNVDAVPYYSNPNILCKDVACGVANESDAARALTDTVASVSAWRVNPDTVVDNNLISNGNFETLDNWQAGKASTNLTLVDDKVSGEKALQVADENKKVKESIYQILEPLAIEENFQFSVSLKKLEGRKARRKMKVMLYFKDDQGKTIRQKIANVSVPSTEWIQVNKTFKIEKHNLRRLLKRNIVETKIVISQKGKDGFIIDDMILNVK